MKHALTLLVVLLLVLPGSVVSAHLPANPSQGEPTTAAEAAAQKAKAEAIVEERYQALVAKLPPDERAWEQVLQSQLGSFYLPIHKRKFQNPANGEQLGMGFAP